MTDKRIDHRAYIASLSPDLRGTLLDMLIDLLPSDGALEGAEELAWLVEHLSATSQLMDARVQLALRRHRDAPPMTEAQIQRLDDQLRQLLAGLPDDAEVGSPSPGWQERVMEKIAAMQREERREKRRQWFASLWRRLVRRR